MNELPLRGVLPYEVDVTRRPRPAHGAALPVELQHDRRAGTDGRRRRGWTAGAVCCQLLVVTLLLAAGDEALAQGRLDLPEPQVPAPITIEERGESPVYYRLTRDPASAIARASCGAAWKSTVIDDQTTWGFALEIMTGAEISLGRVSRAALLIEGGYGYVSQGEHSFLLGPGLVFRNLSPGLAPRPDRDGLLTAGGLSLGLVPHLVLGSGNGELAYGIRTTLLIIYSLIGLSVSHQYVSTTGRTVHELQVGLDLYFSMGRR